MNLTTPKSLTATILESEKRKRKILLRGKRANVFLKLMNAGREGISRFQDGLLDDRLARHICDLKCKGLEICNVGSHTYPTYVMNERISRVTLSY